MHVIAPWIDVTLAERIGWTLVHSVWQIALVTALFAVARLALRGRSASSRYVLGCVALAAMTALPAGTFVVLQTEMPHLAVATGSSSIAIVDTDLATADAVRTEADPPLGFEAAPQPSLRFQPVESSFRWSAMAAVAGELVARLEFALPWITISWLVGVFGLAMRPLWGLVVVRRLKTRGLSPLSTELRKLAGHLMVRLRVHAAVQFAESALVEVPTVVGYFRPMVLLPASAITGLSNEQLEMILAHELAHVRRHDYMVNLAQTAIEALLFYHPGMWWVSAEVRREREHCCDDVAMSVCGNRGEYVRALYTLEARRPVSAPALAASGGSLVARVRRIARGPHSANRNDRAVAWLAGLLVLAVLTMVLALGQTFAEQPAPEPATADETTEIVSPAAESEVVEENSTDDEPVRSAVLTGRVLFRGEPPKPQVLPSPAQSDRATDRESSSDAPDRHDRAAGTITDETLLVGDDGGIANVVVWLRDDRLPVPPYQPLPAATIRATEGRFDPHVLAFWNHALLGWKNDMPEAVTFAWRPIRAVGRNRLLKPDEEFLFNVRLHHPEPRPTQLTSNLQPAMRAYILPLAHPYFAVTDSDGKFEIQDLPAGDWEVGIWHERAGWLKTDRFESGRFRWKFRPGENSVGDLWVDPATLDMSTSPSDDESAEEAPKRFTRPATLPPLPTLDGIADRSQIDREIDAAFDELEERGEGHVIVGRVLVEGDDDPTLVNAQMEILGGGYFAGPTRDLHRPVGFVMHGYEPYLLSLAGQRGAIVDVGTIQMKRLPPEKLVPIVGRIELEGGGELGSAELQLRADVPAVNTPSNGTSPRPRWPDPIEVELDAAGRFYATGFSPTEYDLTVVAPGFVQHWQRANLRDTDIANLGTIKLERPRWVEVDYVVTQEHPVPLDDVKHVRFEGGSRWQITPHPYRWDLEFKQRNGQLLFSSSYGPSFLADLGEGELADFAEIDAATAQNPPMLVPLVDNHVYLFRRPDWENGSEDVVLFKLRTNSEPVVLPKLLPPQSAARPEMGQSAAPDTSPDRNLRKPNEPTMAPGAGSQVDRLDAEGFSQLHRAASGGYVERVRALLDRGANVNVEQGMYHGTPLQYAAGQGHGETVQLLIDRGANVDARDANMRTPLVWAAMRGHRDVARRLLDAGADVNATNAGGWTPIRYAADRGHIETVQLLTDRGARTARDTFRERVSASPASHTQTHVAEPPSLPPMTTVEAEALEQLLGSVRALLPTGWRAEIATNVPLEVILPWRRPPDRRSLVVWRIEQALGEPNVAGRPGGSGPDDRPWEKVTPCVQLTSFPFLSPDEHQRKAQANRDKLSARIKFVEQQMDGIPRQTKEPHPPRPTAFQPLNNEQRGIVREYEQLWSRTAIKELPTRYYKSLAFLVESDGYILRDKAIENERTKLETQVRSLLTAYRGRETALADASPSAVVATVLGQPIPLTQLEPPPSWYEEQAQQIERHGLTAGQQSPDDYRARQLASLIAGPLFDEYRKQEQLEPTEKQIAEFLKHYRIAKVRSQQERARELEQLRDEVADLDGRLQSGALSVQETARSSKRLEDVQSQIATIEKAPKRYEIFGNDEKQDRFFAEWQVRNWNLQASLYRRYGGRAVWQQAGNEALDAMRDYLRDQERDGKFTIHDASLRERFWKIYAPKKLLFEINDPGRVFEHPWSAME
jgi:beta-lactamase regulating signal transducer with metallopeptidase domain